MWLSAFVPVRAIFERWAIAYLQMEQEPSYIANRTEIIGFKVSWNPAFPGEKHSLWLSITL